MRDIYTHKKKTRVCRWCISTYKENKNERKNSKIQVVGVESSRTKGQNVYGNDIVLATSITTPKDEMKPSFFTGKYFMVPDTYTAVMVDVDDYKEYNILIGAEGYYEALASSSYKSPKKLGVVPVFRIYYDYLTGDKQRCDIVDHGVQRLLSFSKSDNNFVPIDRSENTDHPKLCFLKYYNSNAYEVFTGERGAHGIVKGRYFGVPQLLSDIASLFEVYYNVPPGNEYGDRFTNEEICEMIVALTAHNNLIELEWDGVWKWFVSRGRKAAALIVPSNILASQNKSKCLYVFAQSLLFEYL